MGSRDQRWNGFFQDVDISGSISGTSLQGIRFAGNLYNGLTTIQAAITDAGTTGVVIIPSIYAGVDSYTNPNSILILDLRSQKLFVTPKLDITNTKLTGFNAWVNVKDDCLGVVYDGTTDDSSAINNCISANPGKTIFFPRVRTSASAVDVFCSTAITVPNNRVMGSGGSFGETYGTKVKFAAGVSGFILTGTGSSIDNIRVIGSDPAPSSAAQAQGVNVLIPSGASMSEYSKTISTISRTADVTTVRFTNVPHWFPANGIVTISGVAEDPTFNGTYYIATTSQANTGGASSFTYSQVGAPDVVQFVPAAGSVGLATTYTAHGDGITLRQSFQRVQNVSVEDFGRYGIWVDGGSFVADDWRIDDSNVTRNRAHGLKSSGGDSNAGTTLHLATYYNGLWGIFDTGFLGNTHIAPQASYNFGGAGQKPVAGSTKNITSIARTASVLSVTTSTAHGFSVGHGVFFAGTSGALYDTAAGTVGCFVATVPTTSTFTCTQPGYAVSDQGSTASGTVRLGSWAEVTTGAAIDGGPFTVGRTGSAGRWLMVRPYDEGGQGPNKYSGSVVVQQPLSGGGIDVKWTAGQTTTVSSTGGTVIEGNSPTFKVSTDSAQFFNFQAGATADQFEYVQWKNQAGTVKWAIRADPTTGSAAQWGVYNGDPNTQTNPCFVVFRGSGTIETRINAGCSEASSGAAQVKINSGNNSGTGGLEVYSGGAASALVASVVGTGVGRFSGTVPFTAGGFTDGTNALPWSSVYIGNAATNNIQLTGTATSAKVATLPDVTGNVGVYLSAQDAAVDLASVNTGLCTAERTVGVTGAAFGDIVEVMAGTALEAGTFLTGKVTSAGNVKWQFCNLSGGAVDRASDTYTIKVTK